MYITTLLVLILVFGVTLCHTSQDIACSAQCHPFRSTFDASSFNSHFVPISPEGSYALTNNGLEMYLYKPNGRVTTSAGVNDETGEGATINSTCTLCSGSVTYEIQVLPPLCAGVVVAGILIGDWESDDEIDIEILTARPNSWQTNVFVTDPQNPDPQYGVWSSKEEVQSITDFHSYTIDVNPQRINWSLDGEVVRTLARGECNKNGFDRYPTHPMRLQMGIWDASNPAGTAKWAGGPVDWSCVPDGGRITAVVKSVTVQC
ncbi:glycoside hydrolase [Mycena maculata]|uniref:Glycoside hydrolase n=1 Tax=Mycena maculata TaxID=230809 RepID=A0AAD7JI96_9AGAR|nr:glycoside hydrolase [Mycena maculata]